MGTGSPASERTAQEIERDWLRRRGRRRAKILVVSTVIVVVSLTVIAVPVIRISTSVPGTNPGGPERVRELVDRYQPAWGDAAEGNAFGAVVAIDERLEAIRDGVRDQLEIAIEADLVLSGVIETDRLHVDAGYLDRSYSEDWGYEEGDPEYPHRDAIDAYYRQAAVDYLDAFAASEIPGLLDEMVRTGYARREIAPEELAFGGVGGLSSMREVTRVNGAAMRLEAERGHGIGVVLAFERTLGATRVLAHQPTLIDRIVAEAMVGVVLSAAQGLVARGELGADELRAMGAAMDRHLNFPPIALQLEGEWLMHEDSIIRTHSDDGRGSGYALPAEGEWLAQGTARPATSPSPSVRNIPGLLAPRKRARMERARAFFESMIETSQFPRAERDWSVAEANDISLDMPVFLEESYGLFEVLERTMHTTDAARARVSGVRVLLALELYRLEHGGVMVGSLADLVPLYLGEIPADPLAPDGAFRYRVLDAADEHGRDYLLYSVGGDGIDDGGVGDPDDPVGSLSGRGISYEGTDYVFNRPPDED